MLAREFPRFQRMTVPQHQFLTELNIADLTVIHIWAPKSEHSKCRKPKSRRFSVYERLRYFVRGELLKGDGGSTGGVKKDVNHVWEG